MMKLKITTPSANVFSLLIPSEASFEQLHAALEIILHKVPDTYYSFMLMTDRCAIEARGAEEHRIAAAFARNPVISYYNPYPGEEKYKLELLDAETTESGSCPVVQGTEEDDALNQRLREYCMFTDGWVRRSREAYREAEGREAPKKRGRTGNSQAPVNTEPFRFKKIGEKFSFLKYTMFARKDVCFRVDRSSRSQAELLEQEWPKDLLQEFCRDMGLPVKANWRKQKLAEGCSEYVREHIWVAMLMLTKQTMECYLRLCGIKKGQWYQADPDLDWEAIDLLLQWGFVDLAMESGKGTPILELAEDVKQSFLEGYGSNVKYDRKSPAAVYLSPEMKPGSWQKVIKGYESLDSRVLKLLHYFGILPLEQMCAELKKCYGYRFTEEEWKRYVQMHLKPFYLIETCIHNRTGERYAALRGIDPNEARRALRMYPVKPDQKPVDRQTLEETEEMLIQWYRELCGLLEPYAEEGEAGEIVCDLEVSVSGNNSWGDVLLEVDELLVDLSEEEKVLLWYPLSRLYLRYPVSGLGGYSRIEYAKKHQIENPYTVLNDPENDADWLEDSIYSLPFEAQWNLFLGCERLIEECDDLSEHKLRNCAKKALGPKRADILLMYCYLESGNPKLLQLLHKWEKEGDKSVREILKELRRMMGE